MSGHDDRTTSPRPQPLVWNPRKPETPIILLDDQRAVRMMNASARQRLSPLVDQDGTLLGELADRVLPAVETGREVDDLEVSGRSYSVIPYPVSDTGRTLLVFQDTTIFTQYQQMASINEQLLENAMEGIIIADYRGVIEQVNPSFTRITGFTAEEVVGKSPNIFRSYHQDEAFYSQMWDTLRSTGLWSGEIWNRKRDGEAVYVWECITRIGDVDGRQTKYLALFHDIGETAESEEKLFRHSHYDMLTGLPNRQLFFDRLSQAIAAAKRDGDSIGVLLIDIDGFKRINDSLSQRHGDSYLQIIGERLRSICREEDTVGRLGGDEFGIINLHLGNQNHALEILERINEVMKKPVTMDSYELVPSASIGVTFYPEDGDDSESLIKNADLAMYQAKTRRRGSYALYNLELNRKAQERIQLETDLKKALKENEFELYYQPKVRAADGTIIGAEALVRWNRNGSVVSPAEFIPVAEEMGLIFALGRQIFSQACLNLLDLQEEHGGGFTFAVNISGKQFQDASLVSQLKTIFQATGADPEGIVIEITENIAIGDMNSTLNMMQELDTMGICVSIDDFGTGYSSLAYIKSFTAKELKIDRSFIKDLVRDSGDRAIVMAVISMAHELGMSVTAEGVEDAETIDLLKSFNCDTLQGYYFSKPVPYGSFKELIEKSTGAGGRR